MQMYEFFKVLLQKYFNVHILKVGWQIYETDRDTNT